MNIVLIAGYAGSGKSEIAKVVAKHFGYTLLDKDTLTRPLLEAAASEICGNPHDRHTDTYLKELRDLEYQCLMQTVWEVIRYGSSVVATAPFIREVTDPDWINEIEFEASLDDVSLHIVWVDADLAAMQTRLLHRAAERDQWKLANWADYCRTIRLDLRPAKEGHFEVHNRSGASLLTVTEQLVKSLEQACGPTTA